VNVVAVALTAAERDLLVSALRLLEEHDGDVERIRPLLDLLERAADMDDLRRSLGAASR
jgi:hypothetical protein